MLGHRGNVGGLTMRPTKNWNVENCWVETSREPYQKTKEMTKKVMDWEREYNRLLQIDVRLDFLSGPSKLSL